MVVCGQHERIAIEGDLRRLAAAALPAVGVIAGGKRSRFRRFKSEPIEPRVFQQALA
jgi:hypothetical protein